MKVSQKVRELKFLNIELRRKVQKFKEQIRIEMIVRNSRVQNRDDVLKICGYRQNYISQVLTLNIDLILWHTQLIV